MQSNESGFENSCELHRQYHQEQQENDIDLMAVHFEMRNGSWKSLEEVYAYKEQYTINLAKQKIRNLKQEIEDQELIILGAKKAIDKLMKKAKSDSRLNQTEQENLGGRPTRSVFRERIAKKFTSQWVSSLMAALEIKGCKELEQLIYPVQNEKEKAALTLTERTWRRWWKSETVPTLAIFEKVLLSKIMSGDHAGKHVKDIQTTPDSISLLTLLRFI